MEFLDKKTDVIRCFGADSRDSPKGKSWRKQWALAIVCEEIWEQEQLRSGNKNLHANSGIFDKEKGSPILLMVSWKLQTKYHRQRVPDKPLISGYLKENWWPSEPLERVRNLAPSLPTRQGFLFVIRNLDLDEVTCSLPVLRKQLAILRLKSCAKKQE